jgi:hypothetical protein
MSEEYDADQIMAKREALAACPPGHADRGDLAGTLSYALCVYYRQTLDVALITEAIGVEREALALRPPGHPETSSCKPVHVMPDHSKEREVSFSSALSPVSSIVVHRLFQGPLH